MSKHCWSFLLFIALIISALFSTPISTGRCDKPAGLQPRCSSDSVEFILHEGGELTPKSVHKRMIRGSVFHNAVQKRTDEDSTQTAKIGILNFEQLGDYILAGHGKRASRTPEPTKIRLPISTAVPMIPIGDDPGIEDSKDASPDNSGDWTEAMPINFNKRDDSEEHSASNTATLPLADDPEFHLCCEYLFLLCFPMHLLID